MIHLIAHLLHLELAGFSAQNLVISSDDCSHLIKLTKKLELHVREIFSEELSMIPHLCDLLRGWKCLNESIKVRNAVGIQLFTDHSLHIKVAVQQSLGFSLKICNLLLQFASLELDELFMLIPTLSESKTESLNLDHDICFDFQTLTLPLGSDSAHIILEILNASVEPLLYAFDLVTH